jgi:Domain of unknown function (DUF4307)
MAATETTTPPATTDRTNTVTAPTFPPGRYGRRRSPRKAPRWVLPLLVVGVVAVGLGLSWQMYRNYAADRITSQVTAFSIVSDSAVKLSFQVVKDPGQRATCIVRARSRDGREVGRAEVPVPAGASGEKTVLVTYTLATSKRAVAPEVYGCAPA